jgi:hypothetical protein
MSLELYEIGPTELVEYTSIPSRFCVKSILQIELMQDGLDGFRQLIGR